MPLHSDLLAPLAGDNPAGVNVRYEPVFDQIKVARIEEPALPQGEWQRERKTADYALVVKLAGDVLATRSKDLQVAVWLVEALTRREGFAGLRSGLELLGSLLEGFWEHLYPELEDGDAEMRAGPLEWLGQSEAVRDAVRGAPLTSAGHGATAYRQSREVGTEADARQDPARHEAWKAAVAEGKVSADAWEQGFRDTPKEWLRGQVVALEAALEGLDALHRACGLRFGELAPSFLALRDTLREVAQLAGQLLRRKLEAEPDPPASEPAAEALPDGEALAGAAPAGEPAAATSPPGTTSPAASGVPAAPAQAVSATPSGREDAAARIAAAARWLRRECPTDPAPYLMLRGFRWGELRAQGSTVDPRLLAAPPTEVRARLKGLLLDGRWAELLEASEEVLGAPFGRGWLDLQRYVATACEGLGSDYDFVASGVRGALRALLQDLPQLPGLALMDDSPVANAETRAWLREQGIAAAGGAGEGDAPPPVDAGALDRRVAQLRAEHPQRAIEALAHAAAQERSARARFLRRSEAAEVMLESGLEAVAMPILRELLEQVETHRLEQWEAGETVARTLGLAYHCMEKVQPGDAAGREALYLRVCRLDPMRAILLARGPANGGAGS